MQALTVCDAKITSTRKGAGQFKGEFKGGIDDRDSLRCKHGQGHMGLICGRSYPLPDNAHADISGRMEHYKWVRFVGKLTICKTQT